MAVPLCFIDRSSEKTQRYYRMDLQYTREGISYART